MQERSLVLNIDDIKKTMEESGIASTSVAFVSNLDNIHTEELNVSDKGLTNQATSPTIFGAASLSKPVFAYLVLKLTESRKYKFDLETKLNEILPFDQFCKEHHLKWAETDKDTVERVKLLNAYMVLSHTTGFDLFKQVPIKSQFEPGKGYVYSNLAMYYLQKVIEKLISGDPELILMQSPPTKETLNDLPTKSNTAYVRAGNQLFYVNKPEGICKEIKIEQNKLKQFDEKLSPTNEARTLSEDELKQISFIIGFTPSNLIFQTLATKYVFDPIGMHHSSFYREYELDLMPEGTEFKPRLQTIYLKETDTGLSYTVLGLDGELKSNTIPWSYDLNLSDVSSIIKDKEKYLPILLGHTANAGYTTARDASAHNSLYTTAEDYARFVRYWLNDVKMMKEAFRPVLFMMGKNGKINDTWAHEFVSAKDMKHIACGLGWDLETNDKGEVIRAYKTGDMNQWRSQVAIDFEKQTAIVYFANSRSGHILADQIITPNVDLKHGHNYFFQKFGFARDIESDYDIGLMSETKLAEKNKIYLEWTKEGLQIDVRGLSPDNDEKYLIPWFRWPEELPKDPAKIIELHKTNKFLPTLLLEEARFSKIDAYLDSQSSLSNLSNQVKNTNTEKPIVSTHSIFSLSQASATKNVNQEDAEISVLRKRGG